MKIDNNYWFVVEPYVYINVTDKEALLYNTLDGIVVETKITAVVKLLQEITKKKIAELLFYQANNLGSLIFMIL